MAAVLFRHCEKKYASALWPINEQLVYELAETLPRGSLKEGFSDEHEAQRDQTSRSRSYDP